MTTEDRLRIISDAKADMAGALTEKGVPTEYSDDISGYGDRIRSISGSDPQPVPGSFRVRFISPVPDHYGNYTISTVYVGKGGTVELPDVPQRHDIGLSPDGWTHTQYELTDIQRDIDVGAQYITDDGKTHAHVTITSATGLVVSLYLDIYNNTNINWGDGNEEAVSRTGVITHEYDGYDDYVIRIWSENMESEYTLGDGSSIFSFLTSNPQQLTRLFIGYNVKRLPGYALEAHVSLRALVIPNGMQSIQSYALSSCNSLGSLILPNSITSLGNGVLHNSGCLRDVIISKAVTTLTTTTFNLCRALAYIESFDNLMSLGNQVFNGCDSLRRLYFLSPTPPTITFNTFSNISRIVEYYVPDESIEIYKTATNWIAIADQIYPMSELWK